MTMLSGRKNGRRRRAFCWTMMLLILACLLWPAPDDFAQTLTDVPRDEPASAMGREPRRAPFPPHNTPKDRYNTWVFDMAGDPNLEAFARESRPLKSAYLILPAPPQRFQSSPDALDLRGPPNDALRLSADDELKIDLLEFYDADELLDILSSNTGQLTIPSLDPAMLVASQVNLITEIPAPWYVNPLVIIGSVFSVCGVAAFIAWQRKRRAADRLRQETEARMALVGNMASTIVHDVKNAFTAIRSCAEVMGDDALNDSDRKDFAQLIVHEIDRGVDMTQELLDFSSGKHRALKMEPANVTAVLSEILSANRQNLQNRQITVQADLHDTGPVMADAAKLRRVFLNIITNACDAMPDGGSLTIAAYQDNGCIHFDFADSGCGMPPNVQARMFEPMMTHGKPHGTGLGLAIVKDILDAHHARISVRSETEKGTEIHITLPLPDAQAPG